MMEKCPGKIAGKKVFPVKVSPKCGKLKKGLEKLRAFRYDTKRKFEGVRDMMAMLHTVCKSRKARGPLSRRLLSFSLSSVFVFGISAI